MIARELREILDRRPFRPIRIRISSGQYVDVAHPETVLLGSTMFSFVIPRKNGTYDMGWYNLVHVVKIEPLRLRKKRRA